jgi:hypothetical protein
VRQFSQGLGRNDDTETARLQARVHNRVTAQSADSGPQQSYEPSQLRWGEVPDLLLSAPMLRPCFGCRTVKRLVRAGLGRTAAMMHDRRIVNARGS